MTRRVSRNRFSPNSTTTPATCRLRSVKSLRRLFIAHLFLLLFRLFIVFVGVFFVERQRAILCEDVEVYISGSVDGCCLLSAVIRGGQCFSGQPRRRKVLRAFEILDEFNGTFARSAYPHAYGHMAIGRDLRIDAEDL